MKKCLLISGGEFCPPGNKEKFDYVIACDAGLSAAKKMNIVPDMVIGDFDSYTEEIEENIKIIRLNPIKDDTDTISAVRYAIDRGFDEIHICCAFGGRFDHSIANVQTAAFIEEHGARAVIEGKDTILYSIRNSHLNLKREENSYLSFFAISDICTGVTIKGTKYEVEEGEISNKYPIGVSNEWEKDEAYIKVDNGTAVVIVSKMDNNG